MEALKNKTLNFNIVTMFIVSLGFAYVSADLMIKSGIETEEVAYNWGFLIGRALTGVLLSFLVVIIPLSLFRHNKPLITKGTYIALWVMFLFISSMSTIGSTVPPTN